MDVKSSGVVTVQPLKKHKPGANGHDQRLRERGHTPPLANPLSALPVVRLRGHRGSVSRERSICDWDQFTSTHALSHLRNIGSYFRADLRLGAEPILFV